jgi:hypothetical protein
MLKYRSIKIFAIIGLILSVGCSKEQILWGNNTDPTGILIVGDKYYVEHVEVHSQHTKLTLRGVYGKFNAVCFEKV